MTTDQLVTSRTLLRTLTQVQRARGKYAMQQLEDHESALAEFVLEQLGHIHHRLWASGLTERTARRLYDQVQDLVLTAVLAQREAYAQIWHHDGQAPDSSSADRAK